MTSLPTFASTKIIGARIGERTGYVSDNPLTIFADILRDRTITQAQFDTFTTHAWTDREIDNVVYSLQAAGVTIQ